VAVAVILAWAATGPIFGFSDTWQLVVNTGTTIVTFLMVFLIQNTQNRDAAAVQIKLDELIRAQRGAQNTVINVEALTEEELNQLRERYAALAQKAKETAAQVDEAHAELAEDHQEIEEHLEGVRSHVAEARQVTKAIRKRNGKTTNRAA